MRRLAVLALAVAFLAIGAQARSETLRMAASLTLPPFIFKDTGKGIDIDIVRKALAGKGYDIKPIFVTYGRLPKELGDGLVDGALTVNPDMGIPGVYFSTPYICYQNVAGSLKKDGFAIKSPSDLAGKRVVAFQQAAKLLGPDYSRAVKRCLDYREIPDQENQVAMLFRDRTDVVVMDRTILEWFAAHTRKADTSESLSMAVIFPPTCYSAGFTSKNVRDDFDAGLKALVSSGGYDAVFKAYGITDAVYPEQLKPYRP